MKKKHSCLQRIHHLSVPKTPKIFIIITKTDCQKKKKKKSSKILGLYDTGQSDYIRTRTYIFHMFKAEIDCELESPFNGTIFTN